jgi:hypothetical protein
MHWGNCNYFNSIYCPSFCVPPVALKCKEFKSTEYCAYVSEVVIICLTGFLGSVLEYFEDERNVLQT